MRPDHQTDRIGPTAFLVGATGLIGSSLLHRLVESDLYSAIYVMARSAAPERYAHRIASGQLCWLTFDDQLPASIDHFFCALGTTQKVAGKTGLERVDRELVVQSAQQALSAGASLISIVSAQGANAHSAFFYNRIKGKMEQDVEALNSFAVHFWQPSVLLGEREEHRLAESLAACFLRWPLPVNVRARPGSQVASAMLKAARSVQPGCFRFKVSDIDNFNKEK